jgi:hypothetical protein
MNWLRHRDQFSVEFATSLYDYHTGRTLAAQNHFMGNWQVAIEFVRATIESFFESKNGGMKTR